MDENELTNLFECPNCGAHLPPAGADGIRYSAYCETSYRSDAPSARPAAPHIDASTHILTYGVHDATSEEIARNQQQATSGKGCAAIMVVLLLVLGAGVLIWVLGRGGFSTLVADKPDGQATFAQPAAAGSQPTTLYAVVRKTVSGKNAHAVVRLDSTGRTPVWTSQDLAGSSVGQAPIVTDATNVFIADGSTVYAFATANGLLAWQGELADEFQATCEDCFFLAGNRLIVESTDSTYQAFDTATGAKAWTRKARDTSAYAAPFGDKTLLLDDDEENAGLVILINPDGSEAISFQPTCLHPGDRTPEKFDNAAALIPLQPANAIVFGYGSPYPCWQRIDMGTGTPIWSTPLSDAGSPTRRGNAFIASQGTKAAIVDDSTQRVSSLSLEAGELVKVSEVQDVDLVPLGLREGTLILRIKATRGSARYSIHAIDIESGSQKWNVDIAPKIEPGNGEGATTSFLSSDESRFLTKVDATSVRIVTFSAATRDITIENVDIASGKIDKKTVPSGVGDSLPYFREVGWSGAFGVFRFGDAGVIVLDAAQGSIAYRYP